MNWTFGKSFKLWNFDTNKPRNSEAKNQDNKKNKKPTSFETTNPRKSFIFQVRESLPPLNPLRPNTPGPPPHPPQREGPRREGPFCISVDFHAFLFQAEGGFVGSVVTCLPKPSLAPIPNMTKVASLNEKSLSSMIFDGPAVSMMVSE